MTLEQLSAAATEGECPCCGAPCEVTTTPARDFEWKDEYGNYQRTYHHATSSYAYRTGQLVAVTDDAIERVARAMQDMPYMADWDDLEHEDQEHMREMARIAIAAMKGPKS